MMPVPSPPPSCVFIGAVCLDIVLSVPSFPVEDGETRVASVVRSPGGNACNSALVAAQLLALPSGAAAAVSPAAAPSPDGPACVVLIAPCSDPALDSDAGWLVRELSRRGVEPRLSFVAPTGLPTSYIALAPTSRTILHARSLRELSGDECAAAAAAAARGARAGCSFTS